MAEIGFSLASFAGFCALLLIFTQRFRRGAFAILLCALTVGYLSSRFVDWDQTPPVRAHGSFVLNTKVRLKSAFYGCLDQQDLDRVVRMLDAGDRRAMIKAVRQGGCAELEVGTQGTVADSSVFHGSTCVRRAGEPDCLWIPTSAIDEIKQPIPPT